MRGGWVSAEAFFSSTSDLTPLRLVSSQFDFVVVNFSPTKKQQFINGGEGQMRSPSSENLKTSRRRQEVHQLW